MGDVLCTLLVPYRWLGEVVRAAHTSTKQPTCLFARSLYDTSASSSCLLCSALAHAGCQSAHCTARPLQSRSPCPTLLHGYCCNSSPGSTSHITRWSTERVVAVDSQFVPRTSTAIEQWKWLIRARVTLSCSARRCCCCCCWLDAVASERAPLSSALSPQWRALPVARRTHTVRTVRRPSTCPVRSGVVATRRTTNQRSHWRTTTHSTC